MGMMMKASDEDASSDLLALRPSVITQSQFFTLFGWPTICGLSQGVQTQLNCGFPWGGTIPQNLGSTDIVGVKTDKNVKLTKWMKLSFFVLFQEFIKNYAFVHVLLYCKYYGFIVTRKQCYSVRRSVLRGAMQGCAPIIQFGCEVIRLPCEVLCFLFECFGPCKVKC